LNHTIENKININEDGKPSEKIASPIKPIEIISAEEPKIEKDASENTMPKENYVISLGLGIEIEGDEVFHNKTMAALKELDSTVIGRAIIDSIGNSGKTVKIIKTEEG